MLKLHESTLTRVVEDSARVNRVSQDTNCQGIDPSTYRNKRQAYYVPSMRCSMYLGIGRDGIKTETERSMK